MKNYTLEEGLDSLDRIKLLMEYSLSKTASENVLSLSEQENELAMDRRLGIERRNMQALGYNPSSSSDMRKYRESLGFGGAKIDGQSVSDLLIKVREFFFSKEGMATQVVLSILGSEIGLPVVFAVLDGAILLNDLIIMREEWRQSNLKPWTMEWFSFHLEDGPGWQSEYGNGFYRSLLDIGLVVGGAALGGLLKFASKGVKPFYNWAVKTIGPSLSKLTQLISGKLSRETANVMKNAPKKISKFYSEKMSEFSGAVELLKAPSLVKNVVKKVPKAATAGALSYGFNYWLENFLEKHFSRVKNDKIVLTDFVQDDKLTIDLFIENNPKLFPTGIKTFIMTIKNNKIDYFINNQHYILVDEKNWKLKKI